MAILHETVVDETKEILNWKVQTHPTSSVPNKADLPLGNKAYEFETAVLYIDVRKSSNLPEQHRRVTAAKIYNAFLNGAVRIVRANHGEVRSFNGDSILAFFDPSQLPCMSAVRSALQLVYFVRKILRPQVAAKGYEQFIDAGVGVSYGVILATKAGIRGGDNNDLIWPSTATNLAAKLGDSADHPYNVAIAKPVYERIPDSWKHSDVWLPEVFATWYWKWATFEFAGQRVEHLKTTEESEF